MDVEYFPRLVGLTLEGVRTDYCRTHLPWRAEITQSHGIGHGGAIATLIDSVVVPAIGSESAKLLATASLSYMLLN